MDRYVEDPDGPFLYALAENAVWHQAEALREVIASYLKFETTFSLGVSVRCLVD
jgi:hypothetical protein